jgi:hypothetical protein
MPLERGRVGTGSVLALDAFGPQDTFLLNEDMADSQWDPTYTQTTNFAITQRIVPLPGSAWVDHEITLELVPKSTGDLISNLHLKCSLPALPPGNVYTDQIGRAIFKQVDFMIDGQVIESLNDDWYILRDQLFLDADEKNAMAKAINAGYSEGTLSALAQTPQIDMIIPLDFFFCRRHSRYKKHRERLDKPYFPMCAIYNQRVYLKIVFQKWNWFSNSIADVRTGTVNLSTPVVFDSNNQATLTVSPVSSFNPGMYISGLPIVDQRLLITSIDTANNQINVTSTIQSSPMFFPLSIGFTQVNKTLTIPSSTVYAGTTSTFTLNNTTGIYPGMLMTGCSDYSKNLFFLGKVFVQSKTSSTVTVTYDYQEPRLNNRGETMGVQFIDSATREFNQTFEGPIPSGSSYVISRTQPSTFQVGMVVKGLPGITGTSTVTSVYDSIMILSRLYDKPNLIVANKVGSNIVVNGSNINQSSLVFSNLLVKTSNIITSNLTLITSNLITSNVSISGQANIIAVTNVNLANSNILIDNSNVGLTSYTINGSNVSVNGSNVQSSSLFLTMSNIVTSNITLSNIVTTNVTLNNTSISFPNQTPDASVWNYQVTIANQTDFIEPPQLIIEEVQLTDEERQYIRTTPRRLIVNRAVKKPPLFLEQGTSGQVSIGIGASFPVTMMAWFIRKSDFETSPRYVDSRYSYGYTTKYINAATPITFFNGVKLNYIDLINNAQISLSGNDILSKIAGGLYFTMKQPFDHALSVPTKSIYVYAFGLNPKEYNQGGFLDFSPLNASTTTLSLEFNPEYATELAKSFSLYVFYYGYTIIEIKDGFGRLVFV